MYQVILDGTGDGNKAKVDKDNRVHALSVSATVQENGAIDGNTYNINTGSINLTSSNESALLYFKNNGDNDIQVTSIGYLIGNSTGGIGDLQPKIVRNPTGGTIVSNAVDVPVLINKNFGSFNSLTVDAYKGVEGDTLTGGEDGYYSLLPGDARAYLINTGVLQLPKGSSIGITMTPQTGNTSMNVQVFMSVTEYKLGL